MLAHLNKTQIENYGEAGLPEEYPVPQDVDNLLFYIQRNLNTNTICYALNYNNVGEVNRDFPMKVFWIKYTTGGVVEELNFIQNKAFGYTSKWISNDLFEFYMDSYERLRFFVARQEDGSYQVITKIGNENNRLKNIYVYADELGIFPNVKFIEIFGAEPQEGTAAYERILI